MDKKKVHQDRAEMLGLLQRALNLRPVQDGAYRPDYNPSALLVLADRLAGRVTYNRRSHVPDRSALAAAVRAVADTPFVEVARSYSVDWRPVACGAFWSVAVKVIPFSPYQVRRQVYESTGESDSVVATWKEAAREFRRDYRHTAGAPAAHPDIPTPESVLSVPRYEDVRQAFERLRFEFAAGLLGFAPWHVVATDLLLNWGDRAAARCLATYYPPRKVVRQLRESDIQKFSLVKWASCAYAKF
jgi:hypothetical protein